MSSGKGESAGLTAIEVRAVLESGRALTTTADERSGDIARGVTSLSVQILGVQAADSLGSCLNDSRQEERCDRE